MNIESIFKTLESYRRLPTYQFERRIDAFMLPYLEPFINKKTAGEGFYKLVYPEFPLSVYEDEEKHHSNYADFLFYNQIENKAFFLEFKTDSSSITKKQFLYYCNKCDEGWQKKLFFYVDKARRKSNSQKKIVSGLKFLKQQAPELVGCSEFDPGENLLQPNVRGIKKYLKTLCFNPPNDIELTFYYLAPASGRATIERFIAEEQKKQNEKVKCYSGFYDLADFADITPEPLHSLLKSL